MGDDWNGEFDDQLKGLCEVVYLPRTPEVSTTRIKSDMCLAEWCAERRLAVRAVSRAGRRSGSRLAACCVNWRRI